MDRQKTIRIELEFERDVSRSRELSLFRRNPATWELLLLLAENKNGAHDGVYDTIESVHTQYLGNSALLKFVRERRDDGLFEFLENDKKSKRTVRVQEAILEELTEILERRNDLLLSMFRERPSGLNTPSPDTDISSTTIDSTKGRRE